jgi:molybdate transport system substrate-binding protein
MSRPLTGISSMATRAVLAELTAAYTQQRGVPVAIESVGGVDAARRVQAGESFDVVILASDAVDRLMASGHAVTGSRVDLVHSPVAVAVPEGATRPDVSTEAGLRQAVLAAPSLGYSTGPSGKHLEALFQRWGLADTVRDRVRVPPPGVPVGQWVAEGRVALGFQQLSELMHLPGLQLLGELPPGTAFTTTFSAALCTAAAQPEAAGDLIHFLAGPAADAAKRRHGMAPARD